MPTDPKFRTVPTNRHRAPLLQKALRRSYVVAALPPLIVSGCADQPQPSRQVDTTVASASAPTTASTSDRDTARKSLAPTLDTPRVVHVIRPFYIDSAYDRFTDEVTVFLTSRPLGATLAGADSNPAIEFRWFARCDPNADCRNPSVRLTYGSDLNPSAIESSVWAALDQNVACVDLIFHLPSGDRRDNECFERAAAVIESSDRGVVLWDHNSSLTANYFVDADEVEGRFTGGVEFKISGTELRKLASFRQEYDRRCSTSGESARYNCFFPRN